MDQWPGYTHERMQLVKFLEDRKIANPVVLTGDIHTNWVNNLRVDDRRAESPVVATEFVGTSISSGSSKPNRREIDTLAAENPCVQFYNAERGYVRSTITPNSWTCDFRVVEDVTKPGVPATTRASYIVQAGTAGAQRA
jgi:alkaline phosphatase D